MRGQAIVECAGGEVLQFDGGKRATREAGRLREGTPLNPFFVPTASGRRGRHPQRSGPARRVSGVNVPAVAAGVLGLGALAALARRAAVHVRLRRGGDNRAREKAPISNTASGL